MLLQSINFSSSENFINSFLAPNFLSAAAVLTRLLLKPAKLFTASYYTMDYASTMPKGCLILILGALTSAVSVVQAHPKVISNSKPSDFVLQETKHWLSWTLPFQNSSSDEEMSRSIADLLSWKSPDFITEHFPYYHAGLSYEKLPIFILECGKFDFVALVNQGPNMVNDLEFYYVQGIVRVLKALDDGSQDENNRKANVILDFEGFSYAQYNSPAALALLTRLTKSFIPVVDRIVEKIYVINGNYATDLLYKMGRPLFGRFAERIEMYGPKKSKWQAVLKREFPSDALPSWYGGSEDFKPIAAYG